MLNREINLRFEDWLLSPAESLDFEVKQWLDMADVESQGLVAKALIALENHGGGFLLFGYREDENKRLVPDDNRPNSLEPYLADSLNSIIKRRAEPAFHVQVTLQRHPESGHEFPLVRVSGTSKVPIRSDSATAKGSLKDNLYYIRAPGPESRQPLDASEWDSLLRRVILNQREEILGVLRAFTPAPQLSDASKPAAAAAEVRAFESRAVARWQDLNATLDEGDPARITKGHYILAAKIIGQAKEIDVKGILQANEAARRYTGWPVFVVIHDEQTRPKLVDGCIEAWLAKSRLGDVGHADFWRISPHGDFFLLRGYQEDSQDPHRRMGDPGTLFEATLPIWRVGEFLLRVVELGQVMFQDGFEVAASCEWLGLAGRRLFIQNGRRFLAGTYVAAVDSVRTSASFSAEMLRDLLPDAVKTLTKPLYEHFDFFTPPADMYRQELDGMMQRRF